MQSTVSLLDIFLIIPQLHRRWNGLYWNHPDVCPSICPSVCILGFWNFFLINYWLNSFHTWHLRWWGESLDPYSFRVPSFIFGPLVAKYFAENGVSGTFWKTIGTLHFIHGIYPHGTSLLTPIHFCVPSPIFGPLVAKYLAKNGVSRNILKKLLAQFFSYLTFTLMGWVSSPLYIFVFLA